jgi:hypothetical protein
MNTTTEVRSIFESYWASMFELLGWDYDRRPAQFNNWQPDFVLNLSRSVYVAVVPVHEYPEVAQKWIDQSDCPYEVLIVTEDTPIPSVNGRDVKYSLGSVRNRDRVWQPALVGRDGSRVILRHHAVDLAGLADKPIDESAAGRYIQTKWEQAKAQATGHALILDPEEFEKEKDFQKHVIETLAPHWHVHTKVRGRHFADKAIKYVDLIITPRDLASWKDDQVVFGVELKNRRALDQTNKVMKWLGQCVDYTNSSWEYSPDGGETWIGAGYIHVFACPSLIDSLPGSEALNRFNDGILCRLMAQLGIGELKLTQRGGWSLVKSGDHILWSQLNGVEDGRKDSVRRKFGSR